MASKEANEDEDLEDEKIRRQQEQQAEQLKQQKLVDKYFSHRRSNIALNISH